MLLLSFDEAFAGLTLWLATFKIWAGGDDGLEDSPSKMIYIAAGIVIAIAAVAFAISVFNNAKTKVPDPAVPTP